MVRGTTWSSSVSAICPSCARLAVRPSRIGSTCASTTTWILIVSPPRERPRQRSAPPFLPSRPADGPERRCCRSSGCRRRARWRWGPSAGPTRPPSAIARSGCNRWCAAHTAPAGRAAVHPTAIPRRRRSARGGHRRAARLAACWKAAARTRHSKSVRSYRLMPMLNQGSAQWARPPAYGRACLAVVVT